MFGLLTPHLRVESVLELTPYFLHALEIDNLLLDVDCTLTRYRRQTPEERVGLWLAQVRHAGIGVCLVSNGRVTRIRQLAQSIALPHVAQACKPLPWGCAAAVGQLSASRKRTAMVGDQIFADIMAGRLAGLYTILVRPMHPEDEPWFTRLKRPLERVVLGRLNRLEKQRLESTRKLPKPAFRPEAPLDTLPSRRGEVSDLSGPHEP